ncbi:MAG: PadR family transcriptional regulator [Oscillospiraceae bacterium]|nr:PadR family transcriptional regulator [Oscillospiraceae bacterium]
MSAKSNEVNYKKGIMSLVILSLLKQEDMYGYQLVQEINRQSAGRLVTQEGSLYPVLYRLQSQGYITDRKVLVGKRLTRIYYHIEPGGVQYLNRITKEYEDVTEGVLKIIHREDE